VRRNGRCTECPAPTLLPESEPAIAAYLACSTQWRAGSGGRTGLDYPACELATRALRDRLALAPWPELLPDLQLIEHAILQCDREHRERAQHERELAGK
jgi:hypothetical protein